MAEMVKKSSGDEILNHWILAISCILLIISGYGFLFTAGGHRLPVRRVQYHENSP